MHGRRSQNTSVYYSIQQKITYLKLLNQLMKENVLVEKSFFFEYFQMFTNFPTLLFEKANLKFAVIFVKVCAMLVCKLGQPPIFFT